PPRLARSTGDPNAAVPNAAGALDLHVGCATVNNSRASSILLSRALLALATLGVTGLIAGCGSSGNGSTITIGNENAKDNTLASAGVTPTAQTPTSGPLATEPKVTPPGGKPPEKLVSKDIIVGTGPEA